MAALTDRQKARERLSQVFQSIVDKMIPADEAVPLPGGKRFVEWEVLADEVDRSLVPVFLEERAALEASAQVDGGGRCPHCGSERVYLMKQVGKVEVRTPHGPVVLYKQRCRCRSCGRSFSPSRAGLGVADGGRVVSQGGGADSP
jgi:DNA-directed RNA polymerase subunit RPC12/RpoP